jgi:MoaA/NifB/PqqE/SkfB family radical SAM enzyme
MVWTQPLNNTKKLPELWLMGKFAFDFDGMPLHSAGLPFKVKANLSRLGIEMQMGLNRSYAMPPTIQIEPTNFCNLQCPLCPTGNGTLQRPAGFMTLECFQKIIGEIGSTLIAAILYGWGEPFLNKDLPEMIRICSKNNIQTLSTTNGHMLQRLDSAIQVVDAGLKGLIIALDGSTQEVYQRYRHGGNVEKVKRCIENIEAAKIKLGVQFPYTNVRLIVTKDTEAEIPKVEALARNLGANMFSYKTVGMSPNADAYHQYEPAQAEMKRFKYQHNNRLARRVVCPFPFRQPTIFWDGSVVGCEYDYQLKHTWGKIGQQPFSQIWNSPRAVELRRAVRQGRECENFCTLCPYQDRQHDSTYLKCKEIRPLAGI